MAGAYWTRAGGHGGAAMASFDTTRWSIVLEARAASPESDVALGTLCRTYRPPVLAYIRHRGHAIDVADDLTQAFFARFIERAWHADADPSRGRFRAFLLTAVKRFLIDRDLEARRLKRGGGAQIDPLDTQAAELADDDTPEAAFDREWAIAVVDAAMARLRAEAEGAGKLVLFEQLCPFIAERPDELEYERVALALGMRRNTLAVAVHRLRQRLREFVRDEILQTAAAGADADAELATLRDSLAAAAT